MRNKRNAGAGLLSVVPLLCCVLVCAVTVVGQGKSAPQKTYPASQTGNATSPDQMLKLGFFYYNNDDISDKAATQFRAVIAKYPNSAEAETAQFYLGGYFQRKFYVLKAKYLKEDRTALAAAQKEYRAYTDRYYKGGSHQWLADAFFNLALVYLQLGDKVSRDNAGYELDKMSRAAALDNSVYIYQVIYSQSSDDIIDGRFSTQQLASYTSSLVRGGQTQSFSQQVAAIRNWCRQPGTKQAS